jgi:hypothetical protein
MNVRLDRVGHLEVDDEGNVRDVDTTTGEIGRDEDVVLARPDRVERGFSLLLVLARVEGDGVPLQNERVLVVSKKKNVSSTPRDKTRTGLTLARWSSFWRTSAPFF